MSTHVSIFRTPLPVLKALDEIVANRAAHYLSEAFEHVSHGKERVTRTALELEANALRDAAEILERRASRTIADD